jgi:proteasome accessory factor B
MGANMAASSPNSRTPLARMLRIHQQLVSAKFPNCSSLAALLEVSTKTVQRDIEYMRDQLGLPLAYDARRVGYHYSEPVTHFPSIPTTEGEVLALFVAQKALEQYRGTPFEAPLASAFVKLAQAMEDHIQVDLGALADSLSFRHTGVALTRMEVFQAITRALKEWRELHFHYKKLNGRRPEPRRVQPCHLASIDGQWYLFAHDLGRNGMRTFVLGRIQDTPRLGERFEQPRDFSLGERLMGSFGVFSGEGSHRVRISFDAFAAQLVRERVWHPSQEIKELPGGRLELALQLDSLEEIERWVLSWGGHARVIGPRQLQQRVRAVLDDLQDAYAAMPSWFAELHEAAREHQPQRLLQLVMGLDRRADAPGQMHFPLGARD